MKNTKEYYVCSNINKDKFMDKYFSFNGDIQEAIRFSTKEHCKEWIKGNEIETAKPLKIKVTFVFR